MESDIHFQEAHVPQITNQKFGEYLLSIPSVPRAGLGAGVIVVHIAEFLPSRIHAKKKEVKQTNKQTVVIKKNKESYVGWSV